MTKQVNQEEVKEEAKTDEKAGPFCTIPDPINSQIHDDPNLYVVRKKPKRAPPGTKAEKATEVQQRVGQENLTSNDPAKKRQAMGQNTRPQNRPPPQMLKLAAMIWKKSANRKEG